MQKRGVQIGRRHSSWRRLLRGFGPLLFIFLVTRIDSSTIWRVLRQTHPGWFAAAVAATPILVLTKSVRWQTILRSQGIHYPLGVAFLSYYVGLFVGVLTPGRLGEFVRALHLVEDRNMEPGRALSSVAADRLFDLYALLSFAGLALVALADAQGLLLGAFLFLLFMTGSLTALLWTRSFETIRRIASLGGKWGRNLTSPQSILNQIRSGLRDLRPSKLVAATALTLIGYGVFFAQCFWLARSLFLPIGFMSVSAAVALGSLVALIPITVAGIGTREAAVIAYLGQQGVPPEEAVTLSILVFANFYLIPSAVGALLSLVKPVARPK